MRVYVDQSMCTGTSVCEALAPHVFSVSSLGVSTVRIDGEPAADGGEPDGAQVTPGDEAVVREAAGACPGACIHLIED